jgi:hypothetical protein
MPTLFRSLSSAFILAVLAAPALAQSKRSALVVVSPEDEKAAEANVFMNAKLISIDRDRDRIEVRDTYGVRRTFVLANDASLPPGRVKAGSEVILSVRGSSSRGTVLSVRVSEPSSGRNTALMNVGPTFMTPNDTSAPSGLKQVAAAQASFESGVITLPPSASAPQASPVMMGGGAVVVDPRTNQASFIGTAPGLSTMTDTTSTGMTQISPFLMTGSGVFLNTPQGPLAVTGGPAPRGSDMANGANATVQPSQTRSFLVPAAGSTTPMLPGQPTSLNPSTRTVTAPTTRGQVTGRETLNLRIASPPTSAQTGTGALGNNTGTIGTTFNNSSLGGGNVVAAPGAGTRSAPGGQTLTFTAPGTISVPTTSGLTPTGTTSNAAAFTATGAGAGTSGFVTAPGTLPGEIPPQFSLPGSVSIGPSPAQFGNIGSSTTIRGGTGGNNEPPEGGLGSDAAPLPVGRAVQAYEASIARLAMRAEDVNAAFRMYRESCIGASATGGTIGAREWSGIWNGSTAPVESRDQCDPILAQALQLGRQVQRGVQTAEDMARRSGVLPGITRQIRAQYGMDWGGWDR